MRLLQRPPSPLAIPAGLAVGFKRTAVWVVDQAGRIVRRGVVDTHSDALLGPDSAGAEGANRRISPFDRNSNFLVCRPGRGPSALSLYPDAVIQTGLR